MLVLYRPHATTSPTMRSHVDFRGSTTKFGFPCPPPAQNDSSCTYVRRSRRCPTVNRACAYLRYICSMDGRTCFCCDHGHRLGPPLVASELARRVWKLMNNAWPSSGSLSAPHVRDTQQRHGRNHQQTSPVACPCHTSKKHVRGTARTSAPDQIN
jgi:hypothetical protein